MNIVLNIPHSSVNGLFDRDIGKWQRNALFINDCVNKWTDWYTDMLFSTDNPHVNQVVFPYSRFVCDAERLVEDPFEEIGQGIIYTYYEDYKRGYLSDKGRETLMNLWRKHQSRLVDSMDGKGSVIIDCHSFPSKLGDCDICIGHNNDWSYDERLVSMVVDEFMKNGYTVKVNEPYGNSITPKANFQYKSLMIEVNKRVYMNEKEMSLLSNPRQWNRWFGVMERIYRIILNRES